VTYFLLIQRLVFYLGFLLWFLIAREPGEKVSKNRRLRLGVGHSHVLIQIEK